MNLVMQSRNVRLNAALKAWIEKRLAFALGRFGSRLTEVRAVVQDENGPKGGIDKRCTLEAHVRSGGTVVVDVKDLDLAQAVGRAADRMARRIRDMIERRRDIRRRVPAVAKVPTTRRRAR